MRINKEIIGVKGLNHSKAEGLHWCASLYDLKRLMLGHKLINCLCHALDSFIILVDNRDCGLAH